MSTASDLLVTPLNERSLEECYRTLRALVDAHNKLVYHIFPTENSPVRERATIPEAVPFTGFDFQSIPIVSRFESTESERIAAQVALRENGCRCVVPSIITSLFVSPKLCLACGKEINIEEKDNENGH